MVPANATDRLQPLDVSVNKAAKYFLRKLFHEWYAEKYGRSFRKTLLLLLLILKKPIGAQWMIKLYDYFQSKPEIIQNGFKHVRIIDI